MDYERLTDSLRRRCLHLSNDEKERLIAALRENLALGQRAERLQVLADGMRRCVGFDFSCACRTTPCVTARNVFAYHAYREGFKQTEIGRVLGLDHSSVHHCIRKTEEAMRMGWADYMMLNERYKHAIQ